MTTDLSTTSGVAVLCALRDAAARKAEEGARLLLQGHALLEEAKDLGNRAAGGHGFSVNDRRDADEYRRLFLRFSPETSLSVFNAHLDATIWVHILHATGMHDLMDEKARSDFYKGLATSPKPVTVPEIDEYLRGLHGASEETFRRGIARVFSSLDRRFRSHDGFKLGTRIILTRVYDQGGYADSYGRTWQQVQDVERVFAVLDDRDPEPGALYDAVRESRGGSWGPRAAEATTRYFKIRTFKNGNAHLWFLRPELVKRVNLLLAEYYGELLPDGFPAAPVERTEALAKDLSFYRTPAAVVSAIMNLLMNPAGRILEPSAGVGSISAALLAAGHPVTSVEVHPERAEALHRLPSTRGSHTVHRTNFLTMRPEFFGRFGSVVMNPPFYGTHWAHHVLHAYEFLEPGGWLIAVLPATAEFGVTRYHEAVRALGERLRWIDLPEGSFKDSGTNVQTVILMLRKPK